MADEPNSNAEDRPPEIITQGERESAVALDRFVGVKKRDPPPPLRIHHVLLLTTVVAVLSVMQQLFPSSAELSATQETISALIGAMWAIVTGVAVTLVGLGIAWCLRGLAFFNQPGHFLALSHASWFIVYLVQVFNLLVLGDDAIYQVYMSVYGLLAIAQLGIFLYATWKVADSWAWKLYFWSAVAGHAGSAITYLLIFSEWFSLLAFVNGFEWIAQLLLVALLSCAIVSDLLKRHRRGWTHWVGVANALGFALIYGVHYIFVWFFLDFGG